MSIPAHISEATRNQRPFEIWSPRKEIRDSAPARGHLCFPQVICQ